MAAVALHTVAFPGATALERAVLMNTERVGAVEDSLIALQKRIAELESGLRNAWFSVRDWSVEQRIGGDNNAAALVHISDARDRERRIAAAIAWAGLLPTESFHTDLGFWHAGNDIAARSEAGATCVLEIRKVIERLCGPSNTAELERIAKAFPHGPEIHELLTSQYAVDEPQPSAMDEPRPPYLIDAIANLYLRQSSTGARLARRHGTAKSYRDGLILRFYPGETLQSKLQNLWNAVDPLFPVAVVKVQYPADFHAVNFLRSSGPCCDLREGALAYASEPGRVMDQDALRRMLAGLGLCCVDA